MMSPVERALKYVRSRSVGAPVSSNYPITLNFHPNTPVSGITTIESLIRDGTYRSQFETGTSNGGMTAHPGGARWAWESRIFNGAYDACVDSEVSLRPKYGALNYRADPVGGSRRFGSCHFRLRPQVLDRTTFCYPDSHMQPVHFGVVDRMALIDIASENRLGLDLLDDYIEAHVHGPIRISDEIEAVVLDSCYKGTLTEEVAQLLPCLVEWHDGFRLSVERINEFEHYRGTLAAEALSSISNNGFITPLEIDSARAAGLDHQLAKWAWHCVARFGLS